MLQKLKFSKNVNNKKHAPKLTFLNEKKNKKIRIIFEIENWFWKSEIGIFWSLDLERMLILQFFFFMKKRFFHSIKLRFDTEVDEKFLNVIYLKIVKKWKIVSLILFFLNSIILDVDVRKVVLFGQKQNKIILQFPN